MAFGQYEVTFSFGLSDFRRFSFRRKLSPETISIPSTQPEHTTESGFTFRLWIFFLLVDWNWWLLRAHCIPYLRLHSGKFHERERERVCNWMVVDTLWKQKGREKKIYCNIFTYGKSSIIYLIHLNLFFFLCVMEIFIFMWTPIREKSTVRSFIYILFHLKAFNDDVMQWNYCLRNGVQLMIIIVSKYFHNAEDLRREEKWEENKKHFNPRDKMIKD